MITWDKRQFYKGLETVKMERQTGFTLAEMAIVVLLIGILMTMGVGLYSSMITNTAITLTKQRQQIISDALTAYLKTNLRLPCPDSTDPALVAPNLRLDGIEDRVITANPAPDTTAACFHNYGTVPYATLNLPKEVAMDGWEGFFFYQVSNTTTDWTLTTKFNPAVTTGDITVTNGANGGNVTQADNVAVVVISYGKNQSGAITIKGTLNAAPTGADEISNTRTGAGGATTFVKRDYNDVTSATGGTFDDIVTYLQAQTLHSSLYSDDALITLTRQRQQVINDALVAYLRANFRLPCPDSTDPALVAPSINLRLDGIEDRANPAAGPVPDTTQACITNYGVVPYLTLNIPKEVVTDGWDGYFLYQVSNTTTDWTITSKFNPAATTGDITVTNGIYGGGVTQATNVAAVVISYGQNQAGATKANGNLIAAPSSVNNPDEFSNTRLPPPAAAPAFPNIFVKRDYNSTADAAHGGPFDDFVTYVQPQALLAPLYSDGTLKAESDKLDAFLYPLFSVAMNDTTNCLPPAVATPGTPAYCAPDGLPTGVALPTTSIYGTTYDSTANVCYKLNSAAKITVAAPAGSTLAFTITVTSGATTITIPRTVDDVRAAFQKYGKTLCL